MYYYDGSLKNYYKNLSTQELLDHPPKGVAVRTWWENDTEPQVGVLEIEVQCFRILPFLVAVVPVLFSFYLLYVSILLLYSNQGLTSNLFAVFFLVITAWIWYKKPIEVLAYGLGKVRVQLSAKGVTTPLYIGEKILKQGEQLSWDSITSIEVNFSEASRADNEQEIRLYQNNQQVVYLYDYYTQKQLFYVASWLQWYHQYYNQPTTGEQPSILDWSEHLLEE